MSFTTEQFTEALKKAVETRGANYVYPQFDPTETVYDEDWHTFVGTCRYQTSTGEPACIIGLAISILGAEVPDHGNLDNAGENLKRLAIGDDLCREAADYAQGLQDSGSAWGDALNAYLLRVGGLSR